LRTIKHELGEYWNTPGIQKPVYKFLQMLTELGNGVSKDDLLAIISSAHAKDFKLMNTYVAAHEAKKHGRNGVDAAIQLKLPFRLIDLFVAEQSGKKVVNLVNGELFSIRLAKEKIERFTGMSYEAFLQLNAEGLDQQFLGEKERWDRAQKVAKLHEETERGKHWLQKFGSGFKNSVSNLANYTVDSFANAAAALAADEIGGDMHAILQDEDFIRVRDRAKGQTDMLFNVVLSVLGPTKGLMFLKDHGAPFIEYLGSRMSTAGGRAEGERALKEHLESYNVTNGGAVNQGLAGLNLLDLVSTVAGARAKGVSKALKAGGNIAKGLGTFNAASIRKSLGKENLSDLFNAELRETIGLKFSPKELTGKLDWDGDVLGRLVKAKREGDLDFGSASGLFKSAVKAGLSKSDAGAVVVRAVQTQKKAESLGASSSFPEFEVVKNGKRLQGDLDQLEEHFDIEARPQTNLRQVASEVDRLASKKPVFDMPLKEVPKAEAVRALEDEIDAEIKAYLGAAKSDAKFFDRDVPNANRMLQEYAASTLGRQLSPGEIRLYHIISSLLSAKRGPAFDAEKGFLIFKRFLRKLDSEGLESAVKELHPFNNKFAVLFVNKKRTNKLDLDADGNRRYSRFSNQVNLDDFARLRSIITEKGSLEKAVEWLMTKHPTAEVESLGRNGPKHEYLKDEYSYGMFGLTGDKRGAYALNRNGVWDVVAKDVWFTRLALRFMGKPVVSKAGNVREVPLNKEGTEMLAREYMSEAIANVGSRLGLEPAQVAQILFASEQWLYGKLGHRTGQHQWVTDGLQKAIRRADSYSEIYPLALDELTGKTNAHPRGVHGTGEKVRRDRNGQQSGTNEEKGGGKGPLQQRSRGSYSPVEKVIRLVKWRANVTTIVHELAGHWLHDVLKDHEKYGPILEKHYGKFDVEGNRQNLERFARDVETYWMTSIPPRPELGNVFKAIRASFARIYRRTPTHGMDPEVRTLFEEIDDVMDDEVAGLVRNFEKLQSVERDQAALKRGAVHVGGAAARSEQRRRDRGMLVPLDGGEKRLRLSPDEMRLFLMAR